mgnify:CR=1 FL=1
MNKPQLLTPADLPILASAITIVEEDALLLRSEGDVATAEHLSITAGRLQYIYRQLANSKAPRRQAQPERERVVARTMPATALGKARYHADGYGRGDAPEYEQPSPQQRNDAPPEQRRDPEPQRQRDDRRDPEPQRKEEPKRDDRKETPRRDKEQRRDLPPLHPPLDNYGDPPHNPIGILPEI